MHRSIRQTMKYAADDRYTQEQVMIACVTNEVTLIVQPAIRNSIDRIHLLHFVKEGEAKNDRAEYYQRFYEETERQLKDRGIEVVEHSEKETYIFRNMMAEVHMILREEVEKKGSKVYVNMSAGTSEYAAAAAISSMMFPGVEIFTVSKGYDDRTVDYGQLLESAKKDGKLVGSCSSIGAIYSVEKFPIQSPDEYLLKAFKVYTVISDSEHRNSNTVVIRNLVMQDLWLIKSPIDPGTAVKGTSVAMEDRDNGFCFRGLDETKYTKLQRKEAVQYCRAYIDRWLELGWIERVGTSKKYTVTDEGRTVLDVFCPESLISFGEEDIVIQKSKHLS